MALIPLTRGLFATVDDDLFHFLNQWKWSSNGRSGYAKRGSGGRSLFMHRVIVGGPTSLEIDHINGDKIDNRRENLRLCTRSENACNRGSPLKRNAGLPKGVCPADKRGRFVAKICVGKRAVRIGTFDSPEEAARAYDAAAIIYHGEFACLNFPASASAS